MTVEETYIQAAKNGRLVELVDESGRARIVEPYMVYESTTGERLFHVYQLGGFSRSHVDVPAGWRNPKASSFVAARELFASFKPRKTYNPANLRFFPNVIYAVRKPGAEEIIPVAAPHPV